MGNEIGGPFIFQKHIIHVLLKSPISGYKQNCAAETHQQEMSEYKKWGETNYERELLFYIRILRVLMLSRYLTYLSTLRMEMLLHK